jgi:hypothetical protein
MNQRIEHDGHVLEIEQSRIDVSSSSPRPSPYWKFTDAAGHQHAYDTEARRYPTLAIKEGEPYWDDDLADEVTDSWYECALCGERITPGTYVSSVREYEPGPLYASIDGEPVTEQQANDFIAQAKAASSSRRSGKTAAMQKAAADAVRAGDHVHIVGASGSECVSGQCNR